jgi:uncharacterized protein
MGTCPQPEILEAMMQPVFYPHPVSAVRRCETHISTVFLTGAFVYKIKKPVDLGFLDFTTLEKRRWYCRHEVALNSRLSSGVYIAALPITFRDGRYRLEGTGPPVEFAVKMHQLAEADGMLQRLRQSVLDETQIEALVHRLVDFYAHTATDRSGGTADALAWEENLQLLEASAGSLIDRQRFAFICGATRSFYRRHQLLFQRRRADGKIKDGHGDLRSDHIYYTQRGIQIIDCIEFDDRLRHLDIINDLAFLAMDLEYHRFPETARSLMRRYVKLSDDLDALALLDFYRCYRALVRCKVSCCRLAEAGLRVSDRDRLQTEANAFLSMAHGYAVAFSRPILWLVCGLPASGKSTIAKALAAILDISVIRSDVVRKDLFADARAADCERAFEQGLYTAYATETTYRKLFVLAREEIKKGQSVVIDATFSRTPQRVQALRLAASHSATPVFVECRAAEPVLAKRLKDRENRPSVSDARLSHLAAFQRRFVPMSRIADEIHLRVDTERPLVDCLRRILLADALFDGSKGGIHV